MAEIGDRKLALTIAQEMLRPDRCECFCTSLRDGAKLCGDADASVREEVSEVDIGIAFKQRRMPATVENDESVFVLHELKVKEMLSIAGSVDACFH